MIILDDFLAKTYPELKEYSLNCEFKDEVNPMDGVVYPYICKEIPEAVNNELMWFIGAVIHRSPKDPLVFMRMSPQGVSCPHTFHNDQSMGTHTLLLYLNDGDGGTGMARHKETGIYKSPMTDDELQKVVRDQNSYEEWDVYDKVQMQENRAVIFDSTYMHTALPWGGFGDCQDNSRVALICFFS